MTSRKSKWVIGLAGAACVACSTLPIGGLALLTVGSATLANFLATDGFWEILVCLIPLLIIGIGLLFLSRRQKSRDCCTATESACSTTQCEIESKKK